MRLPLVCLIPMFTPSSLNFSLRDLEGTWNQVATNDPTIPPFCTRHLLRWTLGPDKESYTIDFRATCFGLLKVHIPLHGIIRNGTLYENVMYLPPVFKVQVVDVESLDNKLERVQFIVDLDFAGFYRKKVWQMWSRDPLTRATVQRYIEAAQTVYQVKDVWIT